MAQTMLSQTSCMSLAEREGGLLASNHAVDTKGVNSNSLSTNFHGLKDSVPACRKQTAVRSRIDRRRNIESGLAESAHQSHFKIAHQRQPKSAHQNEATAHGLNLETGGFAAHQRKLDVGESAVGRKLDVAGFAVRRRKLDVGCKSGDRVTGPTCKSNLGCFLGSDVESDDESSNGRPRSRPQKPPPGHHSDDGVLRHRLWQDMTTEDFENLEDIENTVAILPVAAVEQHGPHLPVCTDACINEGILKRALELLPPNVPALVLPAMPIGKSNEHLAYPGTLSLSAETLTALWTDIGRSVAKAGVRKMLLFNSHGGQPQIMDIVARELRIQCHMFVVTLSWFSFGTPDGLFSKHELRHGIHGGAVETSMMMYLRPDLVKYDKCANFESLTSKMESQGYKRLQAEGSVGFGWQMQDLHVSGAAGDATDADVERGEKLVDFAAERLAELLGEVYRYPLTNLKTRGGVDEALEAVPSNNGRQLQVG